MSDPLARRVDGLDWDELLDQLDDQGALVIPDLLPEDECRRLAALYARDTLFRSSINMQRHNFGRGAYRYFAYPLPPLVAALRHSIYPRLVPLANAWNQALGKPWRYPPRHEDFLERCRQAGQGRPTPLLLEYRAGDYNRLHQDLYGEQVFPLQLTVLLSAPGKDFSGGEFVLTEQRPRVQSKASVLPLTQGDAVIFAVNERPVRGSRGYFRVRQRHGVSEVREGLRHALGIIFHDAA